MTKRHIEIAAYALFIAAMMLAPLVLDTFWVNRLQDQAGARFDQKARGDQYDRERTGDQIVGLGHIRIELEAEQLEPAKIGQSVEAVGDRLRVDDQEAHEEDERLRDVLNENAGDPLAEHHDAEQRRDAHRQHDAHGDAEPLVLERYPQERGLVDAAKIGL